eukprot:5322342-Pyramimonas_sp.AAC.2
MKVWAVTKAQLAQISDEQKAHMKIIDPREIARKNKAEKLKVERAAKAKVGRGPLMQGNLRGPGHQGGLFRLPGVMTV